MRRPGIVSRGPARPGSLGRAVVTAATLLLLAGALPASSSGPDHYLRTVFPSTPVELTDKTVGATSPLAQSSSVTGTGGGDDGSDSGQKVLPLATGITVTLNASNSAGLVPFNTTLTATAKSLSASGATVYHFSWLFGDASAGRLVNVTVPLLQKANSSLVHHYGGLGVFNVSVNVTDNLGADRFVVRTLQISSHTPLTISANATPPVITLGSTTRLESVASGGYAPYIYGWSNTPGGCNQTGGVDNCTPASTGTWYPRATVVDAKAYKAGVTLSFIVNPRLNLLTSAASAFRCNGTAGVLFENFSGNVTGGTAPYAEFWSFGDGSPDATGLIVAHQYPTPANFTAVFSATDSGGGRASKNVSVSGVFPSCGTVPPPTFELPLTVVKVAIGIFAVLIGTLALLVWMGRRRPPQPMKPSTVPSTPVPSGATASPSGRSP